jgi:hypothetical protein
MTPGLFELKEIRPLSEHHWSRGVVLIGAGIRLATTWVMPKETEDKCAQEIHSGSEAIMCAETVRLNLKKLQLPTT